MWEIASIAFFVRGFHLFFSKQFCDCFEKLVYGYSFTRADVDKCFVSFRFCCAYGGANYIVYVGEVSSLLSIAVNCYRLTTKSVADEYSDNLVRSLSGTVD